MITCPRCHTQNSDRAIMCAKCGTALNITEHVSTRTLEDADYEEGRPHWGTATFNTRTCLVVNIRDSRDRQVYDFEAITELVLGRTDPETGSIPDIDLEAYGAAEKGVSRRHASILRRDHSLNIIDHGTPNGTYLNGQRLIAHQPRMLRDGDELRLGHLVLRISFARA